VLKVPLKINPLNPLSVHIKCLLEACCPPVTKVPIFPLPPSKKILETLTQYFSEYGEVEKVDIITEKSNDKPRGFAFVYFLEYEGFQKAVNMVHHLNGRRIDCKEA
jgi:hypothetical protein